MAYGIGQEIEELTELGVDELTQRQSVNPQLKYALALQEATNLVNAAARERDMAIEQPQPPQVIGQLEQGLAQRLMPGVGQMAQQQPQQPQQPQQGISNVAAPNMMMAGGGIVSFADGGSVQPIPALMDKYGSEMVMGFLEGEKQLKEESKYVAPEYADAYKQKRDNFYSHYPQGFLEELYTAREGQIDISEDLLMAEGGTIGTNNPYNIRDYSQNWDGEAGATRGFVDFENEALGVRAADKLLENYQALHGVSTVREVIARFAPPNENITEEYIEFVADKTGFTPDQPIDLSDSRTRDTLLGAMGTQESGYDYDENILAETDRARPEIENGLGGGYMPNVMAAVREISPLAVDPTVGMKLAVDLVSYLAGKGIDAASMGVEELVRVGRDLGVEGGSNAGETLRRLLGQTDAKAAALSVGEVDEGIASLRDTATRGVDYARDKAGQGISAARDMVIEGGSKAGETLRRLLGQTDAKAAALSVGENEIETADAAQARRAADSAKELIAARDGTQDRSGYSIDGIKEALVNLLGLDGVDPSDPANLTDEQRNAQRMRQLFPELAVRSDAEQEADAEAEINLLNAAQGGNEVIPPSLVRSLFSGVPSYEELKTEIPEDAPGAYTVGTRARDILTSPGDVVRGFLHPETGPTLGDVGGVGEDLFAGLIGRDIPTDEVDVTEENITRDNNEVGITEENINRDSNAGDTVTDEVMLERIARAIGGTDEQIDNARTNASERFTLKGSNAPPPPSSGGISSVQDRYDQLTTPQSGSEAFFDLLKTLGGGGGRSKGYEFAGISERGAELDAARSKEALDIIGAENRAAAVAAQGQTDQRRYINNYIAANYDPTGGKTEAELSVEASELYLTVGRQLAGAYGVQSDEMEAVLTYIRDPFNRNDPNVEIIKNSADYTPEQLRAAIDTVAGLVKGITAALAET